MAKVSNRKLGRERRTCVITGATSGIGRAAAIALNRQGFNLILVARRENIGARLAKQLSARPGAGRVMFIQTDLSSQLQVRALAIQINALHEPVDVLINNAGAKFNAFQQSVDGVELTFATNYLGHFLLTVLLVDSIAHSTDGRVITVGSSVHAVVGADDGWCLTAGGYDRKIAYAKSKLAGTIFAYEISRRLAKHHIVSNSVDPGGVATNLGRNNGWLSWLRHLAYYALKGQLLMPRKAGETVAHLASDAAVRGISGKYFHEKREVQSSVASHDRRNAQELWNLSLALTRLADTNPDALGYFAS